MAVLDRVMRSLAVNLANVFGTSVSVVVTSPATYDPDTRSALVGSSETVVSGVLGTYRADQFGDQIQQNDLPLYLPARDIERPRPGDLVTVDGRELRVVAVMAHYSGAEPALYECQVRQ